MSHSLPSLLTPYVRDSLRTDSLTLITSTLSTPASWLLVRFVKAALDLPGDGKDAEPQAADGRPDVVLVSVYRPQDLWIELSKKIVGLPVYYETSLLNNQGSRFYRTTEAATHLSH